SAEAALVVKGASAVAQTTNRLLSAANYDDYNRYYGRLDPKRPIFENAGPGFLFNDAGHFDDRFVAADPFYQEFSAPLGTRHTLDYFVGRNRGDDVYLAAMRSPAQGPYDPIEAKTLREAGRHFLRALRLRDTVRESRTLARHATAALEGLNYGVAILDARQRIAFANGFALRAFAECRELTIRNSRLTSRSGDVEQAFTAMLRRALEGAAPASMMRLTRSNGRTLFLWCARLAPSNALTGPEAPSALVVIRDPQSRAPVRLEDLQALYGLTSAEGEVALALGRGERLDAIAAERRVKLSTVRTQLLSVLAKMGLARQADLTRTLASLAKPVSEADER
ncbi:MAG TPA: hypothetical protein VFV07_10995, partial [Rhizomicrobium sp.]|nr:hypothetical protein [Rhizomicrobium sp.]